MNNKTIPQDIREKAKGVYADFMFRNSDLVSIEEMIASALHAERLATEARVREECGHPLTARDLSDVFGCVWNSALGATRQQEAGFEFASILAEAFAAMSARLNEIAAIREGR